jgi:hypothetical protein
VQNRQHVGNDTKPHRAYWRPIHLPQEMLRRAAAAIRESRSNDCVVLAKAALQAAIRNESDLGELLAPGAGAMSALIQKADIVSAAGHGR